MKALPFWSPPGFSYEALLGLERPAHKTIRRPTKNVHLLCLRSSQEEQ